MHIYIHMCMYIRNHLFLLFTSQSCLSLFASYINIDTDCGCECDCGLKWLHCTDKKSMHT